MSNNQSSIDNRQCLCGQPAHVAIVIEEFPIVSNDVPFGRHVCRRCHFKHKQFKAEQPIEWLDYFEPRLPLFPFEYGLPQNAILRRGRGIPFEK